MILMYLVEMTDNQGYTDDKSVKSVNGVYPVQMTDVESVYTTSRTPSPGFQHTNSKSKVTP